MKKIILYTFVLGLLVAISWLIFSLLGKKEGIKQAEIRAESIPAVSLRTLSDKKISLLHLSKGIPTVLIYFNSTCEICQLELKSIGERMSEFDDTQILLVSSQEVAEVKEFYETHFLKNFPNVYWLMDEQMEVSTYYGVRGVPAIFCYDAAGKLQGKFQGPVKVDLLLERLGISKAAMP